MSLGEMSQGLDLRSSGLLGGIGGLRFAPFGTEDRPQELSQLKEPLYFNIYIYRHPAFRCME